MSFKNLNKFLSIVIFSFFAFSLQGFGQVTNFSPQTINTGDVVTITGSGFGNARGASYVSFPREITLMPSSSILPSDSDYLLWTDSQIQVRVPARAATGRPFVYIDGRPFYFATALTISNAIEITSFSPTSISAGTQSLLTINGNNFGSSPGSVWTRWSGDNVATSATNSARIVSWTDTRIVVTVSENAGSGQIGVLINGNWIFSSGSLNVKFAVFGSPSAVPIILSNTNGAGGYTFRMENNFAANVDANSTFNSAFNKWTSATGVNWQMGPNTPVNVESATDNVNVIKFGSPAEIIVGTLAYTAIHYRVCTSGELELGDIDMIFNNSYNWNFTSNAPTSNQYDFETVALHELGHAHGLVHVNNIGDPMYHTTAPGTMSRLLSPQAIEGGIYMISNSAAAGRTCYPVMTAPAPTLASFLPTIATNGELVTLTGTNFLHATDVYFGTTKATSFNVVSSTVITATVATGASGNITVTTPSGSAILAGFTYQTKRNQTLTSTPLPIKNYGDIDFDPGVIASSGLPVTYTSSNPMVATIVDNKVHIVGGGNAIITATQAGNITYSAASVNLNLVVNKLSQNISFPSLPSKLVSDLDFDPGATASSGLAISYLSSNAAVATIVNSKVHFIGAGTTTITATQAGNAIYNAAASISVNLMVSRLSQTINFPNIGSKDLNSADFEGAATVSSGLPIIYSSSNTGVATIVDNKIHIVGAGTTIITATQAGDENYGGVSVSVNLIVNKLQQTISLAQIANKNYNDPDFELNATVSSGLPIAYSSSNTNVATIINNKVHIVGAGTATITATQSGNDRYIAVNTSVDLTVNKLQQTISFPHIDLKNHNDADFDLNATASSGLPVVYTSSNTAVANIIGNRVHIVAAGTAIITASQAGNLNINAAVDVSQNLDVVFNIPLSNFTIKSTDETCKTSDNGAINITATQTLSYTATVTGNNKTTTYPFNSVLAINNLPAGTYNVCITVAGQANYKQCFDITIKEPKDLAAYSTLKNDGNILVLRLEGSDFYKIELNGQVMTTTDQEVTIPLLKGNNLIKISSNKACQGVIEKVFLSKSGISLYPNPIKDVLNISTGSTDSSPVKIDIHGLDGRLMHSSQQLAAYGRISLDLSKLSKGLYVLTLSIGNTKTVHKIIKD